MKRIRFDTQRRILSKFDRVDGCWIWKDKPSRLGYGRINIGGRIRFAHRVVYEMFIGKIPDGLVIDHLCRNTRCVNPKHLEPVSQRENLLRGFGVGGTNARKTHCINGHKFDKENTHICPNGKRRCRKCDAFNHRKSNQLARKK